MPPTVSALNAPWPLLLAALIGLWAYFGTTVFFEMVRTGWMACF
jgi:hypothetical protein